MSVDWSRYSLLKTGMKKLGTFGRKLFLSEHEIEDVISEVVLKYCLDNENDEKKFLYECKMQLLRFVKEEKDVFKWYNSVVNSVESRDGSGSKEETIAALIGVVTMPTQEMHCYASQVLSELGRLPLAHQMIMARIAAGETPIDIAIEDGRKVAHVLDDMRVSRDWIKGWVKDGSPLV